MLQNAMVTAFIGSELLRENQNQECKIMLLAMLTTNVPYHIETSQLSCSANQLTGSYMIGNIGR